MSSERKGQREAKKDTPMDRHVFMESHEVTITDDGYGPVRRKVKKRSVVKKVKSSAPEPAERRERLVVRLRVPEAHQRAAAQTQLPDPQQQPSQVEESAGGI